MPVKIDINYKLVSKILGYFLLLEGILLTLMPIISLLYREKDSMYFIYSALIAFVASLILILNGRNSPGRVGKREGFLIVVLTWIVYALIGALPFYFSNAIPSFTDSFFESMSGFTTTGSSILNNIESLNYGILFWRALTQWIGGLGIILISIAIIPIVGINGTQLFSTENAGISTEKFSPKINDSAKFILSVYGILTVAETIFLLFGGMSFFDAITQSFSTVSTGGFSTKQMNVGYWNSPYIQYVIAIFMLLSGVNYFIYFFGINKQFFKLKRNEEIRYYLILILVTSIAVMISQIDFSGTFRFASLEKAWRDSFFTITSMFTTTGLTTVNYTAWKPFTWGIIAGAMIVGASAGSSGGGIKVIRFVIIAKAFYYEFKRTIHPQAVIPVRYNNHTLNETTLNRVLSFAMLYLITIFVGIIVLLISGMNISDSVSGMITCIGSVGPGFGSLAPGGSFYNIPAFSKWFLSFVMLLGRLEIFTVLMIFTPSFWKK